MTHSTSQAREHARLWFEIKPHPMHMTEDPPVLMVFGGWGEEAREISLIGKRLLINKLSAEACRVSNKCYWSNLRHLKGSFLESIINWGQCGFHLCPPPSPLHLTVRE